MGLILSLVLCEIPRTEAADGTTPVARWDFGTEETTRLTSQGGVHRDQPGPRPPEFPDFDPQNTAVKFDGEGARFTVADPGGESPFDFTNGDSITLEAWVNVEAIPSGEHRYIIGKGRTGDPGFARDNQNWALRVRGSEGRVQVNFLFATRPAEDSPKPDAHWHRWTSQEGFLPGTGWHHVAVTYTFGEPRSIRGWIDGRPRDGSWDMGGATVEAPVVDDAAVWIASSQGGNAGSSFQGRLDAVCIHRAALSADMLRGRFRREGPEPAAPTIVETEPVIASIPVGQVIFTCHQALPAHDRWWNTSESVAPEVARWEATEFLMPRLPQRYDEWGIREGWKGPVLVRAAADVTLPPGRQKLLVRARGLSRLWVNGAVVARTKRHGGSSDGHEPVEPLPEPPFPGLRAVGFGDQEASGEAEIPADGKCRVVLEAIVGAKSLRAEPGEMLVAVQTADGKSFTLLAPAGGELPATPLTDAAVSIAVNRAEESLVALDDQTRRSAAGSQAAFWKTRHEFARTWVAGQPGPTVPALVGEPPQHPIDAFITDKIARAQQASAGDSGLAAEDFHKNILPILRENCFRCHGDKVKGGLRLNTREAALKSGDSGDAAVVPHDPLASELLQRIKSTDAGERMPPTGEGLKAEQIATLEAWIKAGAVWPAPPVSPAEVARSPVLDDAAFLRRVYFDTVGVPPREEEVRTFLSEASPDKRDRAVDRLLNDERFADHWISYWQDVLAENPNMLKPSLNNTGPFRWFLYEALRDNKSFDRLVTELIMLRGSEREGGSAGFGLAADNDAPFAAKGHVLATAFLGVELQCARCHDSPYHSTKQHDLFSLAAMLARKPVTVPKTSTVSAGFFEKNKARESLIKVTLQPGEPIAPQWPFAGITGDLDDGSLTVLLQHADDPRERLAAYFTAPQNERFAKVTVNRIWKRLIGAGFVEPAHDWEGRVASHPELLAWLAQEFVAHDYDVKYLVRLILTSQTYQRAGTGRNLIADAEKRFFAAPERRRLTAEQVVDSLFATTQQPIDVEEITFDPDARRPASTMISLGHPNRAWMFASLSNERDRPSLSLPRAQAVADVLEAFGWTGSRQNPRTDRESDPTVLQPGVLANSTVVTWVSRASADSELARLALAAKTPDELVDSVFLRVLSRLPSDAERTP